MPMFHKDSPAVGDVHATTALGNQRGAKRRRIAAPMAIFAPVKTGTEATAKIVFEIAKSDPDQQLIFGWASVSEEAGQAVVDKQGDIIPSAELESAAYDFVLNSRNQGDMHTRTGVGRMVESMMFSKQKQDALGIDLGKVGWWTGFKVDCPELWTDIKAGRRPEFSIGGMAVSEKAA